MSERVCRKEKSLHCWWERKLVQPLWKPAWRFLKKLVTELPYDQTIPPLGIYPEKTLNFKRHMQHYLHITPQYTQLTLLLHAALWNILQLFTAALFTTAKTWKQPRCPSTDEWKKMWYAPIHTRIPPPHKKEYYPAIRFSLVQSLSRVQLFATPWTAARQASLSITNSRSPPKPMSIESVMPPSHLILCRPLLLLHPIPPSITVFSNDSVI